jgi:hypothetical protein
MIPGRFACLNDGNTPGFTGCIVHDGEERPAIEMRSVEANARLPDPAPYGKEKLLMSSLSKRLMVSVLGILALVLHAGLALVTSFGEGIAAADSHGYIPEITRTLWVVALLGTLAGAVTLTLLVMGGTFLLLKIYGVTWIWLIGCFVAGNLIYTGGSKTTIVVGLVDLVLPVASIILAWWAISTPHSPRNATE